MKDYSELKGLPVKIINNSDNLKFKDCYVAEIDDCGLTILGFCTNHNVLPSDKLVKCFCLHNEIEWHLEMFPETVKMIMEGTIDCNIVYSSKEYMKKIYLYRFTNTEPACAFE